MTDKGGTGAADSYIGSLISLTSKSEIRYEGLLYTVDTENSNIALQNVRSFGTEGRKKDGPQVPASDKVYEFIIFRGTDIKDLQVKKSPPPSIHSDPAIISLQAQVSQPAAAPPYIQPVQDLIGNQSTYKTSSVPYYHTANSGVPLWGAPPPPQVPSVSMPYYWQGFYRPRDEHRLLELSSGLDSVAIPAQVSSMPATSTAQSSSAASLQSQASTQAVAKPTPRHFPTGSTVVSSAEATGQNQRDLSPSDLVSNAQVSSSLQNAESRLSEAKKDAAKPNTTKGKPFHGGQSGVSYSSASFPASQTARKASGKSHQVYKQVYRQVQPAKENSNAGQHLPATKTHSAPVQPLLPLPISSVQYKPLMEVHAGAPRTNHMRRGSNRGGRIARGSRAVQSPKLLEDFDFIAMNQKFNKEEVWDELLKVESKDKVTEDGVCIQEVDCGKEISNGIERGLSEIIKKSVYVKDDFFDSLSCDALDREHGRQERLKFSEQRKIDVETFGSYHLKNFRVSSIRGRHGAGTGRGQTRGRGRGRGVYGHNDIRA
ncbi:hypothetical protein KP509_04G111700 [Ceratopteris richardii]|uniref:Uncharacterized protein n=3 Tax=Ceratopteris richardii TaxID=49495 RepID=A0A8T2V097_CERRI|nr:hypothetical protein KP509_04G111700 [Ceratopteris richardii]KAH7440531.1 hypothetical protein KP509_04G111700 [Ceratopteris richardii]